MRLVFVDNLESGMVVGEDIHAPENRETVLIRRGTRLSHSMISSLAQRGVRFAYIQDRPVQRTMARTLPRTSEREGQTRPAHNLFVPAPRPVLAPKLRQSALEGIQELFGTAAGIGEIHDSAQVIRHLDQVVEELVDTLQEDPGALVNIHDLKSYDEYTFHHSLSVAVLSLAIGQHFGYGREELHNLGMSAILHDIGKTAVPIELIHKTSKLTDEEFAVVKNHSPAGYDYLKKHHFNDSTILEGVLFHHEKMDGTGYPQHLEGERIPIWSRIISVADVYDALTSNRPYRTPMQPGEAIEYIMGSVGTAFDYDVTKAFVEKVELYPVGRTVQLSNDRTAKVLDNQHPMRPLIRMDDTGEIIDLYLDRGALSLVISRLLRDDETA